MVGWTLYLNLLLHSCLYLWFWSTLFVANCGNPTHGINDPNIIVVNYEEPIKEGSQANFSCHPEYEPIGLHSAKCMGNGEWVPDPNEFELNCSS